MVTLSMSWFAMPLPATTSAEAFAIARRPGSGCKDNLKFLPLELFLGIPNARESFLSGAVRTFVCLP